MLHLIQNIRIIRKQKGISQESIAYDLGIDYSTYGKIERGQIALTVERLDKIAKILGVTIEDIYLWREAMNIEGNQMDNEGGNPIHDIKTKLHKTQLELDSLKREVALLQEQLKDKEKIIGLLEHKLFKVR